MDLKTKEIAEGFHCPYTVFEEGSESEKLERSEEHTSELQSQR